MEMSLQLNCKTVFPYRSGCVKLNPFPGVLPRRSVTFQSGYMCSPCKAVWGVSFVSASADFPRRRQQKKVAVTRPKGTAAKGFVPSKRNARLKKGDSLTPVVSEVSGGDKKQTVDVNIDDDKEEGVEFSEDERFEVIDRTDEIVGDVGELLLLDETVDVIESSQASISMTDEDVEVLELKDYNGGVGIVEDSGEGLLDQAEIDESVKDTDTDILGEIKNKTQ